MRVEAHGADRGCTSVWPEGHSPKPPPAEGEGLGTMKCGSLRCRGPPRSPSNDPGSERDKRAFSIKMSWFRRPEGCRFLLQTR